MSTQSVAHAESQFSGFSRRRVAGEVHDNGGDKIRVDFSAGPSHSGFRLKSVMSVFGRFSNLTPEDAVADNRVEQH
jgi:hypothetical protein